jgi:hypothetical protein
MIEHVDLPDDDPFGCICDACHGDFVAWLGDQCDSAKEEIVRLQEERDRYKAHTEALTEERRDLRREVAALREAIEAHKTATRYNPRAAWANARLWDAAGLGDA